jgi:hypothetical protein
VGTQRPTWCFRIDVVAIFGFAAITGYFGAA